MFAQRFSLIVLVIVFATLALETRHVESRYLPTRANGDRVDKLRELLKELLENEIEKEDYQGDSVGPPRWHPESKLFYKREIPSTSSIH